MNSPRILPILHADTLRQAAEQAHKLRNRPDCARLALIQTARGWAVCLLCGSADRAYRRKNRVFRAFLHTGRATPSPISKPL